MTRLAAVLALLAPCLVVAGVALWSVPAGLVVAGLAAALLAYVLAYAERRRSQ